MLGLVRMLGAGRRRHSYAAGAIPAGELVGELGALHASAAPGREPVWLAPDGRLATGSYRPEAPRGRSLRVAPRWLLAPLTWREFRDARTRLRLAAWRLRALPGVVARRPRPATRDAGSEAGWLDRESRPGSVPLFSGVHPVTADQLLTSDVREASDLGYVDVQLLGYLDSSAPLTGTRRIRRPELPWAWHAGRPYHADGALDAPGPEPLLAPFAVSGWALAPDATVATVELHVDGRFVGRARTGLARPDVAARTSHPDAPVCGFDHILTAADVPAGAARVTATATDLNGRRYPAGEATFAIAAPPPAEHAAGEELRERTRRVVGGRTAGAAGTNVLVATHRLDRGGAQLWLHEVIERLARRPRMSLTVVAALDGPLRARLEELGIGVHVTGDHPLHGIAEYEERVAELAAWAAPRGFDVAVVNALRSFPAVEAAELLEIPSVFAIHESYDLDTWWAVAYAPGSVHAYAKERARRALSVASAAIFEADATRRLYEPHADPAHLITFPYGIELAEIDRLRARLDRSAARRHLGLADDAPLVLCLGLIEPRKAQTSLAQAFAAVADEHRDAVLALVGESSQPRLARHNDGLRDYVSRSGVPGRIRIMPMADDPYAWHAAADLFVCPSDLESLPRVVLEAMAFETPVVATRIFGLPELIDDERTGWLCEPRDVGSLSGTLGRVLATAPAVRGEVGRAARRTVVERHDAAPYAERFAALLEGLAANPEADPRALLRTPGDGALAPG